MAGREQSKQLHEKHQAILSKLLKDDDNKYCVDCDAKGPRWASWNLGLFLCIRCAGIHRNLGVHISKVKSINLDSWTPEQIASMEDMGNSRGRAVYEANLPDGYKRPINSDQAMEQFIRAKYEHKKYIAKEWVPSKPRAFPSHYNEADSSSAKKETKKPKPVITVPGAAAGTNASKASKEKTTPIAAAKPQQQEASTPSLLGDINGTASSQPVKSTPAAAPPQSSADLLADIFSSPSVSTSTTGNADLFGLSTASTNQNGAQSGGDASQDLFQAADTKQKSAKDSIMALYGSSTTSQPGMMGQMQQPMMYSTGGMMGGAYPNQNPGMMGGYQMPSQQGFYQQGMMGNPQQGMMGNMVGGPKQGMMGNMMGGPQQGMMGNFMGGPQQQGMMGGQGMTGSFYNPQQQMYAQQLQAQMANMSLNQQRMPQQMAVSAGSGGGASRSQQNGQTLNFDLWN